MENFVVSARKFRPSAFDAVVGQRHITSTLKNAILSQQLAHAYLFCGPRGVGKTTCARILAKTINCMNLTSDAEACGECESCRSFADNRSFNIHELDAASNNSVDNIRTLTEKVRIPPQIGRYSIYIIDEVHMLTTAAFNAFLKTLEEPPAHAIFILATTEKHKILQTILSRCQIYDFKRIKVDDMVEFLRYISSQRGVVSDDESLVMIAQKADGCMRDALSMYDKVVSFCGNELRHKEVCSSLNILDYDTYFEFIDQIAAGDYPSALLTFDSVMQKGFDVHTFLGGFTSHLRDLLVAKNDNTLPLLEVTGVLASRYVSQSKQLSATYIFNAINIVSQSEFSLNQSLNQRLTAEITILKLCNLSSRRIFSQEDMPQIPKIELPSKSEIEPVTPVPAEPIKPTSESAREQVKSVASPDVVVDANTDNIKEEPRIIPVKTVKATGSSLLGISINGGVAQKSISEKPGNELLDLNKTKIAESDNEKVLKGCIKYAKELEDSRPRISIAFQNAGIKEGEIEIIVHNSILAEELSQNKHLFIKRLSELCETPNINYNVTVNEHVNESKTIFIRDEDKLKFFTDKNPETINFRKTLELDYV